MTAPLGKRGLKALNVVGGIEIAIGFLFLLQAVGAIIFGIVGVFRYSGESEGWALVGLLGGTFMLGPAALFVLAGTGLRRHRPRGRILNLIVGWILLVLGLLSPLEGECTGLIILPFGLALLLWLRRPSLRAEFRKDEAAQDCGQQLPGSDSSPRADAGIGTPQE